MVVAGVAVATWSDSLYNHTSALVALVSNFMMPLRNVILKSTERKGDLTDFRTKHEPPTGFIMFSLISALGSVLIGCITIIFSLVAMSPVNIEKLQKIVVSSLFFFGYNDASFVVLEITDPVTHSLMNVLKRFFNIFCNAALFHTEITNNVMLGLALCFFGMLAFTLAKRDENSFSTVLSLRQNRNYSFSMVSNCRFNRKFLLFVICSTVFVRFWEYSSSLSSLEGLQQNESSRSASHKIVVVPFKSYFMQDDETEYHQTCKKTIVVRSKNLENALLWRDQPFTEVIVDDLASITITSDDDILCIQVGSITGALALSSEPYALSDTVTIGSNGVENVIHQITNAFVKDGMDIDFKVVHRKSIVMSGWYEPTSLQARDFRSRDSNFGNFVWKYGATRMINPYTTQFKLPSTIDPVNATVIASANALYLVQKNINSFYQVKNFLNSQADIIRKHDRPTIVLGIGIQAEFNTFEDTKSIKLFDHLVEFMNEVSKRNNAEKSVTVRGNVTETACTNAGVKNCISLGCPRYGL